MPLRAAPSGFDAVKHLVLCRIERRPPRLDLAIYPYLPFDFAVLPSLNKALVMELARSEYVERRENIIAVGGTEPAS